MAGTRKTYSWQRRVGRNPFTKHVGIWGDPSEIADYEVEADDGYDLVEHIRTAKHFGRDAFLETDVDFFG